MTTPGRIDPEGDRAVAVMSSLQRERDATIAVPGSRSDRFLGRLIDVVLVGALGYGLLTVADLIYFLVTGAEKRDLGGADETVTAVGAADLNMPILAAWLIIIALVVGYEMLFTSVLGATPGKRRTQLQVVDSVAYQPALPPKLLLRSLAFAVPLTFAVLTWFYSLLFAWSAVAVLIGMWCWRFREDSGGRPLWDVVAGTHVITTDYERHLR